jgi:hypothetical protein
MAASWPAQVRIRTAWPKAFRSKQTKPRCLALLTLTIEEVRFEPDTGDGLALIRMTKVNRKEARYLAPEAVAGSRRRAPLTTQPRNDGPTRAPHHTANGAARQVVLSWCWGS